jgi:integrase
MDTIARNDLKYLVLKGKNKDIWSVRIRVPKNIQFLIEKDFINHSTGTSDIKQAREVRDEILNRIKLWQEEAQQGKFNMLLDKYSNMPEDELEAFKDKYVENLLMEYPWAGHPQQGKLPNPSSNEMEKLDAMNVALGVIVKPSKYGMTMSQAMLGNFKYKDYMPTTISNHKRSLKKLNKFLNTKDIAVSKIKRRHALEFKKHLESLKISNGTISRYFADLSVIWNFGRNEEELSIANPFEKHGIKVKATRKSNLDWDIDDLRKVVATMEDEKDKLIVYLAWYTGSRLGECLSVRPEDIYKDAKSGIWVVSIKPDRQESERLSKIDASAKTENARRIVPIHKAILKSMQNFKIEGKGWKRKTPNAYSNFFTRKKRLVKDTINPISSQYTFHSIRHNVATNFQRAKVEESISARLVGHSTVGATMTYGYYSEGVEFEEALAAINKLPGL